MSVTQTSDDGFNHPFRLIGISDADGKSTSFFGRIVVPAGKQRIADKNHLINGNAKDVPKFSNPVGFINARLGDVNGGRASQAHGKLGDQFIKERLDLLPLGEVRVPFFLFFDGRLLSQCGKRNLASPVFNGFSPDLFDFEARCFERLL